MTTNYVNVQNGITVNSVQNKAQKALIGTVTNANLKLNNFHILMFLYGARIYVENLQQTLFVDKEVLSLYMTLNEKLIEGNEEIDYTFSINQLRFLEQFLIARLDHCEKERDERSPRFNPDTYISMKLMLLDIKKLMLGEIIEILD